LSSDIVNSTSVTSLDPSPISSSYPTSNHAVVGLTTYLHYEAEKYGIKVSTLCPTFVDTPIFEKAEAINTNKSKMIEQLKNQNDSPEKLVKTTLKEIHKNKSIICPMSQRRTMGVLFTVFPFVHRILIRLVCKVSRTAEVVKIEKVLCRFFHEFKLKENFYENTCSEIVFMI